MSMRHGAGVLLSILLTACRNDTSSGDDELGTSDSTSESSGDTSDTGETGETGEPPPIEPDERDEVRSPGSITFTEIAYAGGATEWIELHNPMAIDMDLSGWSLAGVEWTFPEGTFVAAGAYVVVAANPGALPGALGPFAGTLDDLGERLELISNGGRRIDAVHYGIDEPWPVAAAGTGLTLAKRHADAASDVPEHWTASREHGGTPGSGNGLDAQGSSVELIAMDATWSYDDSGAYPPGWTTPRFDDGAWASGQATFYAGSATQPELATLRATADNYYGIYLGELDGSNLRLIGQDADGDWTSVESVEVEVGPLDHLYLAAWESPLDNGGPQMTIAEVELADATIGTSAATMQWVLGPSDASPGPTPGDVPPDEAELLALIDAANLGASWAAPAVEAAPGAAPWGWALQSAFAADTNYVWPDTFGDVSLTNSENTYALFRSVDRLLGPHGETELGSLPTTVLFRGHFELDADPMLTTLWLTCEIDDGAVVYLNGEEVLRENMPAGPIGANTLASMPDAANLSAAIPSSALVRGANVLAVEVHQAASPDSDLRFACALVADIAAPTAGAALLRFHELPAAGEPAWVELEGLAALDVAGMIVARGDDEYVLPGELLDAGELLLVDPLGFAPLAGDVLTLWTPGRERLLDAVRVHERGRARAGEAWYTPDAATPGEPNLVTLTSDVVIHEIMYHRAPLSAEGEAFAERDEEWIELYNRGDVPVDLSGWVLTRAVAFTFPAGTLLEPGAYVVVSNDAAALSLAYPDITVLGDFAGRLDNASDELVLLDARGNLADAMRYHDGGRWPEAADGGGSSLELRDAFADNRAPEAWAASDELARASWVTYGYDAQAGASAVGPDGTWHELVLGLLDAGELLLDDVSVVADPEGAAIELLQDGSFESGTASWRILGTHRHSEVVPDPDAPGNSVLRLRASGPTEHMHNHAETTLEQPINGAETYRISFRARWVSGSNQLHTRLYFNRAARMTRVAMPTPSGTPGQPNSVAAAIGPTFAGLTQSIAVPKPGQAVEISIDVEDPEGVSAVTLWHALDGGAFASTPMSESDGRWTATLPGQAAGSIVQFYVEASDGEGIVASFPAAGVDSRALVQWDDAPPLGGLHGLRLIVREDDSDWMLDPPNLMSNDLVGATVVYDESEVFYDVGVRTKGSQRGRPQTPRLGYGVHFHADQPFRGSHTSVLVDRSEGVGYGQREVLMNLVMGRVGAVSAEYNDLAYAITPRSEHTGPVELQLDRFTNLVLDAQFVDGGEGVLHDYELIYYPYTSDDGTPEGAKLPQPDDVIGTNVTSLGSDPEAYRWTFALQNNREADDWSALIGLCTSFAGDLQDVDTVIDVDQWLRSFALATVSGATDNYGSGAQHNAAFYVRPADGRMLYFPHDLDFIGGTTMPVVGNADLARLLDEPVYERLYYQHLEDILARAYSPGYLGRWCDQIGALLPAQNFAGHCQFVSARADFIASAITGSFPPIAFAITTQGGMDFATNADAVELQGQGWIDVREIRREGAPLQVTWLDGDTWSVMVALQPGANDVQLDAYDLGGASAGSDTIVITRN